MGAIRHRFLGTAGALALSALVLGGCAQEWWQSAETDVCESGPRLSAYHAAVYENTGLLPHVGELNSDVILAAYRKAGVEAEALWGQQEIPRVYAPSLPADLRESETSEERRTVFVAVTLPLVLRVNEVLADRRAVVAAAADCASQGRPLSPDLKSQVTWLDLHYGAGGDLQELLRRVDAVPPSLALAQAALESGWGTSQTAQINHVLFGERNAQSPAQQEMQPVDLRGPDAAGGAAHFEHLIHSIYAYAHQLNTDPRFAEFRKRRADLGGAEGEAVGALLAPTLAGYSDRGRDYTRDLEDLIRLNEFQGFDDTQLVEVEHEDQFWVIENS